ncbi:MULTISPECIES: holo-ACP synthase [unclassified Sutcliffiella]|uniref:holo-ACP synthase n=1 Tax=unclassified Sutcliffiella TaxID=2837532 RepID=UPI0030CCA38E
MIIGIGTDIIELSRIEKIFGQSTKEKFINRILTEQEILIGYKRGNSLCEFVAGRLSAKEAVVKAFGCGIGKKVGFQDIIILNDSEGKPICSISENALSRLGIENGLRIHVSISHCRRIVNSFVIIEKNN